MGGKSFYAKKYLKGNQRGKFKQDLRKRKLFVRGLPRGVKNNDLFNFFQRYGKVEDAYTIEKKDGRNRSDQATTGFLIFKKFEDAESLVERGRVQFWNKLVSIERIKSSRDESPPRNPKRGYKTLEPRQDHATLPCFKSRNQAGHQRMQGEHVYNPDEIRNRHQRRANRPPPDLRRSRGEATQNTHGHLETSQNYYGPPPSHSQRNSHLHPSHRETLENAQRNDHYQKFDMALRQMGHKTYEELRYERGLPQIGPYFINDIPVFPDTSIQQVIPGYAGFPDKYAEGRRRIPSFSFTMSDTNLAEDICKVSRADYGLDHRPYNLRINLGSDKGKFGVGICQKSFKNLIGWKRREKVYEVFPKKKSNLGTIFQ